MPVLEAARAPALAAPAERPRVALGEDRLPREEGVHGEAFQPCQGLGRLDRRLGQGARPVPLDGLAGQAPPHADAPGTGVGRDERPEQVFDHVGRRGVPRGREPGNEARQALDERRTETRRAASVERDPRDQDREPPARRTPALRVGLGVPGPPGAVRTGGGGLLHGSDGGRWMALEGCSGARALHGALARLAVLAQTPQDRLRIGGLLEVLEGERTAPPRSAANEGAPEPAREQADAARAAGVQEAELCPGRREAGFVPDALHEARGHLSRTS